jgi:hypothetical protein
MNHGGPPSSRAIPIAAVLLGVVLHTAMPYSKNVIAEIVSLARYESQVSALLNEDERVAMEFYIACTPGDHPVIPGGRRFSQGSLGPTRQGEERRLPCDLLFPACAGADLHG